jgi:glycosyltransferase involved in cell wall biosynthesis
VTYVGRFSEHKYVDWLLEAVATACDELDREVETCIVGDGSERESPERHAEAVGVADHVHFQGFVVEHNADAIAGRIVDVLTDDDLRADLSEGARTYGEVHDLG